MEIEDIAFFAQLASILEVSAPKPGNVNRVHDFADTKYEDFVIAGVAIGDPAAKAAERGYRAGNGAIDISGICIGELIKEAVFGAQEWHSGKNTNLGITMLLIPLSASAGMSIARGNEFRENIKPIIKGTTYRDTLSLYEAVRHANLGGLGSSRRLDVNNPDSDRQIKKDGINLYQIMKVTEGDSIAKELVTSYDISFNIGYPAIKKASAGESISDSIVHGYLTILSKIPDTFIARKNGMDTAEKVSEDAGAVLEGRMNIDDFDASLRSEDNRLNPGTTADLVASSLFIALLKGDLM
jgi:triphosphoribosyl-dephospho-CoA synthase